MNTTRKMRFSFLAVAVLLLLVSFTLVNCGGGGGGGGMVSVKMGGSVQGNPLTLANSVTTFAGTGPSGADGTGAAARFYRPSGTTTDGTNLYVADTSNHTIRRIVLATGSVTTIAGTTGVYGSDDGTGPAAKFHGPYGITTDGTNLYVADEGNCTIRKIVISSRVVTTIAGTANAPGSADGMGAAASFSYPTGITTDGTNLYVADRANNTIRKIVLSSGVVTTIAGAGWAGSADGAGAAAQFSYPYAITTDGTNLYVADTYNDTIRRIIISTGMVSTIAGTAGMYGSADGTGAAASFSGPYGITTDGTNLYVADTYNYTIRKIVISTGVVTTIAGTAHVNGTADGTGPAAKFFGPYGITTNGTNLYVADTGNNTIRRIDLATGLVATIAGIAPAFNDPDGITTDGSSLYVADSRNRIIRRIVISTGAVTTLAGTPGVVGSADGTGAAASFSYPYGITTDGTNLYVADKGDNTIRKIVISSGLVTTLAGTAGVVGSADGTGAAASFSYPSGITTDGTNLYVVDSDNCVIRKIVIATGVVTTLAGTAGIVGSADGTGAAASFSYPSGITTDGTNLYMADAGNYTIRKIIIATGVVTTIAGTTSARGSTDGTGAAARFDDPSGITTDGSNLYVVDAGNNTVRRIQ